MKILILDIETAPNHAYIWGMWQETRSTDFITDDWYIMCWCAKWLGEKKVHRASLHTSKGYEKGFCDDKELLMQLHTLLDEADIVIAHNGLKFDCKKVRARFILNGIKPPSPYRVIDTLLAARANFAFTSNRLDDLGKFLKVGKKASTGGFKLWKDCMNGVKSAWEKMVRYCANDVTLLEKVYLKIRPYLKQHPNLGVYLKGNVIVCPTCGSKNLKYSKNHFAYTQAGKFRRFQCQSCWKWARETENLLKKKKKATNTTNIT